MFTPIWGRFPCWRIFLKWVETTNYTVVMGFFVGVKRSNQWSDHLGSDFIGKIQVCSYTATRNTLPHQASKSHLTVVFEIPCVSRCWPTSTSGGSGSKDLETNPRCFGGVFAWLKLGHLFDFPDFFVSRNIKRSLRTVTESLVVICCSCRGCYENPIIWGLFHKLLDIRIPSWTLIRISMLHVMNQGSTLPLLPWSNFLMPGDPIGYWRTSFTTTWQAFQWGKRQPPSGRRIPMLDFCLEGCCWTPSWCFAIWWVLFRRTFLMHITAWSQKTLANPKKYP